MSIYEKVEPTRFLTEICEPTFTHGIKYGAGLCWRDSLCPYMLGVVKKGYITSQPPEHFVPALAELVKAELRGVNCDRSRINVPELVQRLMEETPYWSDLRVVRRLRVRGKLF